MPSKRMTQPIRRERVRGAHRLLNVGSARDCSPGRPRANESPGSVSAAGATSWNAPGEIRTPDLLIRSQRVHALQGRNYNEFLDVPEGPTRSSQAGMPHSAAKPIPIRQDDSPSGESTRGTRAGVAAALNVFRSARRTIYPWRSMRLWLLAAAPVLLAAFA